MNLYKIIIDKFSLLLKKQPVIKRDVSDLWLKEMEIRTFIDIGACIGEYIDYCHNMWPDAKIYAFEPMAGCLSLLKEKGRKWGNITVYNFALGNRRGESVFYQSSYPPSSSVLKMGNLHKTEFPHTAKLIRKKIKIELLDDVFKHICLEKDIFIKMDTQGFEDRIIKGGSEIFKQAKIIQTEVSFKKLYEGQHLFDEIYQSLNKLGFIFAGIRNQIKSPKNGSILQAHAYFINKRSK
jgi:FkbM family methyltransferase